MRMLRWNPPNSRWSCSAAVRTSSLYTLRGSSTPSLTRSVNREPWNRPRLGIRRSYPMRA